MRQVFPCQVISGALASRRKCHRQRIAQPCTWHSFSTPALAEHISLPQRAHHVNQRRSIVDKDARAFPIEVATQPTALNDTDKLPSPTAILNIVYIPARYVSAGRRVHSHHCISRDLPM
jgi:hypothetical protein